MSLIKSSPQQYCLDLVVGVRPNLVKVAPPIRELRNEAQLKFRLVHTGQHYDNKMSDAFFDTLEIPHEHVNLEVGSASHAKQTACIPVLWSASKIVSSRSNRRWS